MKKMYTIIILIAIVIGWYGYSLWQKNEDQNLNKPQDTTMISQNLDDLVDIIIPQSFELDTKYTLGNFYSLDPSPKNKFNYFFYRDNFIGSSGMKEDPIVLTLSIYDPKYNFEDIDKYIFQGSFAKNQPIINQKSDLDEVSEFIEASYQYDEHSPKETIFVISNKSKNYRIKLQYWDSKLNKEAAKNILKTINSSINIKDELNQRIEMIKSEFYNKYPDKKP